MDNNDYYYLKIVCTKDRRIKNYKLYNDDKLIKIFSSEESKKITKRSKEKNVHIRFIGNDRIIDDPTFMKRYTPNSKISRKNMFHHTAASLTMAGAIYLISGFVNPKDEDIKIVDPITINEIQDPNLEHVDDYDDYDNYEEIENIEDMALTYEENIDPEATTYAFNYEDRSQNDYQIVEKYGIIIDKYASMYGIDPRLIEAIITQENKFNEKNYSDIGGHGLMQVESIWNNQQLTAFNFNTNSYESIIVDTNKATNDDDYGIKVGCMIFNNYYNYIYSNYGNKFNEKECLIASIFSYNKGIGTIKNCINNCSTFDKFLTLAKHTNGGDNEYIEHVLSYIENETTIQMKNIYNQTNETTIKNLSLENAKTR